MFTLEELHALAEELGWKEKPGKAIDIILHVARMGARPSEAKAILLTDKDLEAALTDPKTPTDRTFQKLWNLGKAYGTIDALSDRTWQASKWKLENSFGFDADITADDVIRFFTDR